MTYYLLIFVLSKMSLFWELFSEKVKSFIRITLIFRKALIYVYTLCQVQIIV